jgi:hypothetical protein
MALATFSGKIGLAPNLFFVSAVNEVLIYLRVFSPGGKITREYF